jgi:methylmalonyl-CoA mutase
MTKAILTGIPKMRIEESAARRQAKIDSGEEIIIGVNRFRQSKEIHIDNFEVDNNAVRETQIERLKILRATRDEKRVKTALYAIEQCAASGTGNLLEVSVKAAAARATLGEISFAMEKIFGRHKAAIRAVSGVYSNEFSRRSKVDAVRARTEQFELIHGRRPRIMVAKMGQDGHDRGAKVIATSFADMGFDVDVAPLFQTPQEVARQAVENDIHVLGVSSLAAGHKTLVPKVIEELKNMEGMIFLLWLEE